MRLVVCGSEQTVEAGITLGEAIRRFTPYGDEAVIAKYNGAILACERYGEPAREGDVIDIYPLIIGG